MQTKRLLKRVDNIVENIDTDYLIKKITEDEKQEQDYEIYFEDKKGYDEGGNSMEEIQVGEYVRLKDGLIGQFYNIEEGYNGNIIADFEEFAYEYEDVKQFYEDIVKHSENIIDILEIGDIIELEGEKYQVLYDESYNKLGILIPNKNYLAIKHTTLEYIFQKYKKVTILTKEQYIQNCYKVDK